MNTSVIYRIILSVFIIFSSLNTLVGQNLTDDQGRKQGKWVKKYARGTVRYEGTFVDDKPVGEFNYYYIDGKLKAVTVYSSSGDSAATKSYHKNGKPMAEGNYFRKKKTGKWLYYSDVDGALIAEENYDNGLLDGPHTTFYPASGKPAEIIEYKQGRREGMLLKLFPDGSTMTEGTYVNDSLNGDFTLYYPNGKIQLKGAYDHGMHTGEWKYFDEDGNQLDDDEFRYEILENDTLEFDFPIKTKKD